MAVVKLTSGNDVYPGKGDNTGADWIQGLAGNDTIVSGYGVDTVDGGSGNDVITDFAASTTGTARLLGGLGDDRITAIGAASGTAGRASIDGGDGNDIITLGQILDATIEGGLGRDRLVISGQSFAFREGRAILQGPQGHLTLSGLEEIAWTGTAGGDHYRTIGAGIDTNDLLDGGAGNDWIEGGLGSDTIYGGAGDDTLFGLHSGLANDALDDDLVNGGAGNDLIDMGSSAFVGTSFGHDTVQGGGGNDTVVLYSNAATNLQSIDLYGGSGTDTLSYVKTLGSAPSGSFVVTQESTGLTLSSEGRTLVAQSFEAFRMTASFDITLTTGNEVDEVEVADGGAVLHLGGGDDRATVGTGSLVTGAVDLLDGGAGNDALLLHWDFAQGVTARAEGGWGVSFVTGNKGESGTIQDFETIEIRGSSKADVLDFSGSKIALTVYQTAGDASDADQITGGDRGDWLGGGLGNDTISGQGGDDLIRGAEGADLLTGGRGADVFLFGAAVDSTASLHDTITDFAAHSGGGTDRISLLPLDLPLSFIGTRAFTAANQVRASAHDGAVWIEVNTQGASGAEMVIELAGLTNAALISAADFLF